MAAGKLILCVCGAGINTSLNAENQLRDYFRKVGREDIDIRHAMIGDIEPYRGRENMVVVWMTTIDPNFGMPAVRGLPFVIGSRQAKEDLCKKVLDKLDEISSG